MLEWLIMIYVIGVVCSAIISIFMIMECSVDWEEALAITFLWPIFFLKAIVSGAFKAMLK